MYSTCTLYLMKNKRYKREELISPIHWGGSLKMIFLKVFVIAFNSKCFVFSVMIFFWVIAYWCSFQWTNPFNEMFLTSGLGALLMLLIIDKIICLLPFISFGFSCLDVHLRLSFGALYVCGLVAWSIYYNTWVRLYFTIVLGVILLYKLTWGKDSKPSNVKWFETMESDNIIVENHIKQDFPLFYYVDSMEKPMYVSLLTISSFSVRDTFFIHSEFVTFYVYTIFIILFFLSLIRIFIILYCNPVINDFFTTILKPVLIGGTTVVCSVAGGLNVYSISGPPGVLKCAAQHIVSHPSASRFIDERNQIIFNNCYEVAKNPMFSESQLRRVEDPRYVHVVRAMAVESMVCDKKSPFLPGEAVEAALDMSAKSTDVKFSHFLQPIVAEDTSSENVAIERRRIETHIILTRLIREQNSKFE